MTTYYASIREANGLSIDLYTDNRQTRSSLSGPAAVLDCPKLAQANELLRGLDGKTHPTALLARHAAKQAASRLTLMGYNVVIVS
jgi:CelD/BcsL family acetyltransferase involved in cellulose biosynthesis